MSKSYGGGQAMVGDTGVYMHNNFENSPVGDDLKKL